MRILELFSGSGKISSAFRKLFFVDDVVSVDLNPVYCADLVEDVYKLTDVFLSGFDFIWLSPDCTTYSLASHGIHRKKAGIPVSDYAHFCDINNFDLISRLRKLGVPFIIENPRCHFRNMVFVKDLYRCTLTYSSYGSEYTKFTDLFSNFDIKNFFNCSCTIGTKHLDYCKPYKDFLGRCDIPNLLINDIVKCGLYLAFEHRYFYVPKH